MKRQNHRCHANVINFVARRLGHVLSWAIVKAPHTAGMGLASLATALPQNPFLFFRGIFSNRSKTATCLAGLDARVAVPPRKQLQHVMPRNEHS